jgi:hypothetical protein
VVQAAFLSPTSPDLGSPAFLLHFIASASDPQVAVAASELALTLLRVLRALLAHPTFLAATARDAAATDAATSANSPPAVQEKAEELGPRPASLSATCIYERLCATSSIFARDVFQHTMRAMSVNKHVIGGTEQQQEYHQQEGEEERGVDEQEDPDSQEGPFRRSLSVASRRPLGEVSLSVHNVPPRHPSLGSASVSSQHTQGARSGQGGAESDRNSEGATSGASLLRVVWEPVLLAHLRLVQECSQFAAISLTLPARGGAAAATGAAAGGGGRCLALIAQPAAQSAAFEVHRRLIVADWVYGAETTSASGSSSSSGGGGGGSHCLHLGLRRRGGRGGGSALGSPERVLAGACEFLAGAIASTNSQSHARLKDAPGEVSRHWPRI